MIVPPTSAPVSPRARSTSTPWLRRRMATRAIQPAASPLRIHTTTRMLPPCAGRGSVEGCQVVGGPPPVGIDDRQHLQIAGPPIQRNESQPEFPLRTVVEEETPVVVFPLSETRVCKGQPCRSGAFRAHATRPRRLRRTHEQSTHHQPHPEASHPSPLADPTRGRNPARDRPTIVGQTIVAFASPNGRSLSRTNIFFPTRPRDCIPISVELRVLLPDVGGGRYSRDAGVVWHAALCGAADTGVGGRSFGCPPRGA